MYAIGCKHPSFTRPQSTSDNRLNRAHLARPTVWPLEWSFADGAPGLTGEQDLEVVQAVVLVDADAGSFFYQRGRDPGRRLGRRVLGLEAGRHRFVAAARLWEVGWQAA